MVYDHVSTGRKTRPYGRVDPLFPLLESSFQKLDFFCFSEKNQFSKTPFFPFLRTGFFLFSADGGKNGSGGSTKNRFSKTGKHARNPQKRVAVRTGITFSKTAAGGDSVFKNEFFCGRAGSDGYKKSILKNGEKSQRTCNQKPVHSIYKKYKHFLRAPTPLHTKKCVFKNAVLFLRTGGVDSFLKIQKMGRKNIFQKLGNGEKCVLKNGEQAGRKKHVLKNRKTNKKQKKYILKNVGELAGRTEKNAFSKTEKINRCACWKNAVVCS